jgi:poly(3-hydroxybutyrate) depolymerase
VSIEIIKFVDMKNFPFVIFLLCITCLLSCSSNPSDKNSNSSTVTESPAPSPKENFPAGQLLEKIICKHDTSQSYALYLPSGYSPDKAYPVVFAFDPHGTGKLPVSNYQELAEKYKFILAGSNNSKNGVAWDDVQKIANTFFADVQVRCNADPQRIYLLGFSGGARIANGLTISNGSITGAICCGAAAPASAIPNPRSNYFFMAITGNADFNYTEIRKYDKVDLAGHPVKHALLVFEGKHEWPPLPTMDEAFLWMELNEMRKNHSYKNDSLVSKAILTASTQLDTYMKKKQVQEAYECCRKTINFYDGLTDLSLFFDTYQKLQSNAEIDKTLKKEEAEWEQEEVLKNKYREAVQTNDYNWWQKDIQAVNAKIRNGPKNEALIYKRVLGYLSLMMYIQTTEFIKQSNISAAVHFDKLYLLVDPTNSEAHYLAAELSAIQGNAEEAITYLKSAVKNGYGDKPRLQDDKAFKNIKGRADFQDVLEEIKK